MCFNVGPMTYNLCIFIYVLGLSFFLAHHHNVGLPIVVYSVIYLFA